MYRRLRRLAATDSRWTDTDPAVILGVVALVSVCVPLVAGTGALARSQSPERGGRRLTAVDTRTGTRRVGYVLAGLALVVALWSSVAGLVPRSVPTVVVVFYLSVAGLRRISRLGPRTLRYGSMLAVVGVVGGSVVTPTAGVALPDIGVLGPYTYLATEVAFGTLAAVLLARAGREATRSAARTIALVYPVAYVWDWYTLSVGVFAIPLRTGLEFAGIPLEEHLFMVVVPAFVLGVHETLRSGFAGTEHDE